LLERSTDARAGVQAFFLQLQIDSAQNGRMAFDLLNQGLKGFEDNLTKAIFTGKAQWKEYFRSLEEEAFKMTLNKALSGLFQSAAKSGIGQMLGLDKLIPQTGQAAQSAALTANTTAVGANTAAVNANTARMSLGAGGGGGIGDIGDLSDSGAGDLPGFPGFAGGTDYAPGGFAWVGESGPELEHLPGGSSVTPAASLRSGGGDQHFYIDAKGAEIGVEEKIVRALTAAKPHIIGEAMANFSEVQRRTAGRH
jgi:hypothetical protein